MESSQGHERDCLSGVSVTGSLEGKKNEPIGHERGASPEAIPGTGALVPDERAGREQACAQDPGPSGESRHALLPEADPLYGVDQARL